MTWIYLPWNRDWSTNGRTSVREGVPTENHDCDQMGCSSIAHAVESRPSTTEEVDYFNSQAELKRKVGER